MGAGATKKGLTELLQDKGLTFDDVLMLPGYSEVLPCQVATKVSLTKQLELNTPILSAAMDTVTEHKMAQVMAQEGGFGIIHKNMSIKSQCYEVQKVKKYESGMILEPITLEPTTPVYSAVEVMKKHSISGVPITKKEHLEGILTHRDLRFETNMDQPVSAIMTSRDKLVTAKEGVSLKTAKQILHKHRIEKLPVVDSQGALKGLITIKDIEKSTAFPNATKDAFGCLFVGAAVGVQEKDKQRIEQLVNTKVDLLCVDTAHGHSQGVLDRVAFIKAQYPNMIVMAGNVATADGALALAKAGADIIKVGMGSGSICTTRVVSGVGVPQVSAILQCLQALKKNHITKTIVADGGLKHSGDIAKAIALGAGAVMVGNMLAGSEESPGETILYRGRSYKTYRGMGSLGAMQKGSKDRYRQEEVLFNDKMVPEGVEGRVPYRGPTNKILHQMIGGLKAGMGYVGAKNISSFQQKAEFIKVSSRSYLESHIHGISITKEAPNYRLE